MKRLSLMSTYSSGGMVFLVDDSTAANIALDIGNNVSHVMFTYYPDEKDSSVRAKAGFNPAATLCWSLSPLPETEDCPLLNSPVIEEATNSRYLGEAGQPFSSPALSEPLYVHYNSKGEAIGITGLPAQQEDLDKTVTPEAASQG